MNRPWSPARMPAFWLMVFACALATLVVAVFVLASAWLAPRATMVALPATAVYAAGWLVALLRYADPVEVRPLWTVLLALLWGAAVAVSVGAGAGYFMDQLIGRAVSPAFAAGWGAAIAAPIAEEAAKAAGVLLLFLAARPYLTTVWSGALYGAVIGVGFAASEDVSYAVIAADEALPDDVAAAARVLALRFLVPGLIGHPLFTAAIGAAVAVAWLRRDLPAGRRLAVAGLGIVASLAMHAAVNSPLAGTAAEELVLPGSAFPILAGYFLVVGTVAALPVWWLLRLRRRDAVMLVGYAAAAVPEAIRREEIAPLATRTVRRAASRAAGREHGTAARKATIALHRRQLRLVAAVSRPWRGYAPVAPGWRAPTVLEETAAVDAARRAVPGGYEAPATAGRPRWGVAAAVCAGLAYLWLASLATTWLYPA